MITCFAAYVIQENPAFWINDKCTSQLPGISLDTGLPKSLSKGPEDVFGGPQIDGVLDPAFQPCGAVCLHGGVNQEWKRDVLLFLEGLSMLGPTVPHNDQFRSQGADVLHHIAQLRDLLAAEESAKVANEDKDNRLVLPEASKGHGAALWV